MMYRDKYPRLGKSHILSKNTTFLEGVYQKLFVACMDAYKDRHRLVKKCTCVRSYYILDVHKIQEKWVPLKDFTEWTNQYEQDNSAKSLFFSFLAAFFSILYCLQHFSSICLSSFKVAVSIEQ